MNATDPNHNEYLAAIAGMADHTMPPRQTPEPAVGDFVSGVTAGKRWQGRVEWVTDTGEMCINGSGWWAYVPVRDITH